MKAAIGLSLLPIYGEWPGPRAKLAGSGTTGSGSWPLQVGSFSYPGRDRWLPGDRIDKSLREWVLLVRIGLRIPGGVRLGEARLVAGPRYKTSGGECLEVILSEVLVL